MYVHGGLAYFCKTAVSRHIIVDNVGSIGIYFTYIKNKKNIKAEKIECEGKEYSIEMHLPPLSVTIYRFDYKA